MICLISNPGEPLRLKTLPDRTRAIDEADKARRRQTLLNSALELFLARPTELPSVQSIASRAGLAKGTVYLYFDTKEEIFLTILEELYTSILRSLLQQLDSPSAVSNAVSSVISEFTRLHPAFLPLAAMNSSLLEPNVKAERVMNFKTQLYEGITQISQTLNQRFPNLSLSACAQLLINTQALVLGLWQMHQMPEVVRNALIKNNMSLLAPDFHETLQTGITCLWQGLNNH